MDASEAKHQARLAEWRTRVAECRSSGKSVRTWCAEQGVGYKTYYRWEREILQIASKELLVAPREENVAPVFAELPAPSKKMETAVIASVRMLRIRVKSYRFYAETEFPADVSSLAAFAEGLNRLYETLEGKVELEGKSGGYNRLTFDVSRTGKILIYGALSMDENGQSHEMMFSNSIDQTFLRDFAKSLYKDFAAHEA